MKIGFFSETYLPLKYGVETSMVSFGSNLEELGHEVYVYTSSMPGHSEADPRVFRLRSIAGGKHTDMRFAGPIGENGKLKDFIKNKLDVVHIHTVLTLGLLGKYIARRQGLPTVYTHHNDYKGAIRAYLGKKSIIAYLVDKLAVWFANTSTAVIAPSDKMKQILLKDGVKRPIHILPTGVSLAHFAVTAASKKKALSIRKQYGFTPSTTVLMSLSRIGKEKNVDFLARALEEVLKKDKDVCLMMVGSGPYLEGFKEFVKKLGLADKVIFTGRVPEEDKPAYYQSADMYLYASHHDTQAIVVLEAAASGKPIVILEDGAFKDVVVDGKNGFSVSPDSPTVFAGKVLELIDNDALRMKFSKNSRSLAKDFSEENQTKKLESIYKEIIVQHRK